MMAIGRWRQWPRIPSTRTRCAFTLVELLVVVSIMALLAALLLPAVNVAREAGRRAACSNNLRALGVGFAGHAEQHRGQLCTGAFDWQRDGAVTEIGWVADMVEMGIPVGQLLCRSNPAQAAATYNDLLTISASTNACVSLLGRAAQALPDGTMEMNPCRAILSGGLAAGSAERKQLIERELLQKFYNTNYTASWLLVRSRPRLDRSGNLVSKPAGCPATILSRSATAGPLIQNDLDASRIPSTIVPFLGCGSSSDSLASDVGDLQAGAPLVQPFTAGPRMISDMSTPSFATGASFSGATGWWSAWMKQTLQDYQGFAPVHRGTCNLLMADGGVRDVYDSNGDGVLNNGFPAGVGSFRDGEVEIGPDVVFSGPGLRLF